MRIIHIAPLIEALSEASPGGAEKIALSLAQHQTQTGHQVSIVAAQSSKIPEGIEYIEVGIAPGDIVPIETARTKEEGSLELSVVDDILKREEQAFSKVHNFLCKLKGKDLIVHNHAFDTYPLTRLSDLHFPVVHTLHCPPLMYWMNHALKNASQTLITVSNTMASAWESVIGQRPQVVFNGIDTTQVPFSSESKDYFLFAGRISPEKGLHHAIQAVCVENCERLVVLGRVYDQSYFDSLADLLAHPLVDFQGFKHQAEVYSAMGKAKALLMPIEWEEPFGLVAVESALSGTPVIAFPRGALSEIITPGVNGFFAKSPSELKNALERVGEIDRRRCRENVEERFSIEAMVQGYHKLYAAALRQHPK